MADVQAWANNIAQQLFDGPQDLANEAAANVTDASGLAFFVGKPNGSSGQWTLKKLTPTELGKLVYNYLTTQSIAQQLASVLGEQPVLLQKALGWGVSIGGEDDIDSLGTGLYAGIGWQLNGQGVAGFLFCIGSGAWKAQIAILFGSGTPNQIKSRTYNNGWTTWKNL